MEMAGNAWSSALSGLNSMGSGIGTMASRAPGGSLGAGLMGLSAISDVMGAISRASQASKLDALRKQALSPAANEEITRQVLSNLAQFGVSADSGTARQAVAKALADAQLQRVQAAAGMIPQGTGSSGSIGNTAFQLMQLAALSNRPPSIGAMPATSSSSGGYVLPSDGSPTRVSPQSGDLFGAYDVGLPGEP